MYKNSTLIASIFFFLIFFASYSQDKPASFLKKESVNLKVNDTVRINTIIAAMDNSVSWSKEHIALYNQLLPIFSKGLKLDHINVKVKNKYLFAAGVYYYNTANKQPQEGNNLVPGIFDKAIKYWNASKNYKEAAQALVSKGSYYRDVTDWTNAFKCYFEALKYFESKKDEAGLSSVNVEIGTAKMNQRDWEKGAVYFKKALLYYDRPAVGFTIEDRRQIAVIYNNLGVANTWLKNYGEAHKNYLKAYEIIKLNNDSQSESTLLVQLASSSNDLGHVTEAQEYLKKALALSEDDTSRMHIYGNAASIFYKNKNYGPAAEYGELCNTLAKKFKNIRSMTAMSALLYKIYKQTGQYDNALKMHETAVALRDSTNLDRSKNELAQQQLKYDFEKKELQQKILQQKKLTEVRLAQENRVAAVKLESERESAIQKSTSKLAQQQLAYNFEKKEMRQKLVQEKKAAAKNNWLTGLSAVLLLLLLSGYFYYRNNRQKQAIAVLEKDKIRQQLLITQMNPHFIFNSVQNIRTLINKKQDVAAVDYLERFSTLTRQILENATENYISLAEEIEMIENYLSIQQLLHTFKYTIVVDNEIDADAVFLPPMLAQPFIENAIRHGLGTSGNGTIDIRFYLSAKHLFFEVRDSGKGFGTAEKNNSHKSLAMKITRERLAHYTKNKDFTFQATNMTSDAGMVTGAKVHFEIPYIYEN